MTTNNKKQAAKRTFVPRNDFETRLFKRFEAFAAEERAAAEKKNKQSLVESK